MKKIIVGTFIVVILAAAALVYLAYRDTINPYVQACDYTVPEAEIPKFDEVKIDFKHQFDEKNDLPLLASAMIDIDGDGVDEIFIGGGNAQHDGLFKFSDGKFTDISEDASLTNTDKPSTHGAVSFDLDEDGKTDLLTTRNDGVFFHRNIGGKFETQKLDITTDDKSTPATLTIGDYDKDGDADLFLCTYIKKELMEGQTIFNKHGYGANSILLRNDGDLKFTDVTKESNLTYTHNTFQAVFVDVDDDGWLDLVVAYDTGEARTYKNEDGKTFKLMPNPMTGKFGYPMGIAVGDYNNDSKTDFFFSNTGTTVPKFLAKGDLRKDQVLVTKWIMFKNEGEFKFKNTAEETKLADFEFSWGAVFEDFNLDGRQDLAVAENYIAFPTHKVFKLPCRFLLQRSDGTFASVEEQAGVVNKNFAVTPLTSDFNQDGYPDLVYANLNGKLRVFLNKGGDQNYIKVRFPEQAKFVGAKVIVDTNNGKSMSDVYVLGEGLGSDMTSVLTFGIDKGAKVKKIRIKYIDGDIEETNSPEINKVFLAGETLGAQENETKEAK